MGSLGATRKNWSNQRLNDKDYSTLTDTIVLIAYVILCSIPDKSLSVSKRSERRNKGEMSELCSMEFLCATVQPTEPILNLVGLPKGA